ncbi:MAG: hypothetical protein HYY25_05090 [Candidatus Wallbacteria bacterium]|nr:hypothetical protein [Candidatus Wallbacteria bacterium]
MRRPTPPASCPYPSPEAEYVESPEGIGLRELAAKWRVPFRTVARWSTGNDWPTKRQRFQADIERAAREQRAAKYARQRERIHDGNARLARRLRGAIVSRLAGGPDARELAALSAAFVRVARELRLAYGLESLAGVTAEPPGPREQLSVRDSLLGPPPHGVDPDDANAGDDVRAPADDDDPRSPDDLDELPAEESTAT